MNNKKDLKEHTSFKTYSTLATIFIVTVFLISITSGQNNNLINSSNVNESLYDNDNKTLKENELKQVAKTNVTSIQEKEKEKTKKITYAYPLKGDIIIKFSPTELIYDEILDQYRTSNGITMKSNSLDLNAMCDSKIILIESNNSSKSKIKLMTTDNHVIEILGYFNNFAKKEGDVILKGSKLCNINNTNETSYIEINISKDNIYIDPVKLINS